MKKVGHPLDQNQGDQSPPQQSELTPELADSCPPDQEYEKPDAQENADGVESFQLKSFS